MNADSHKDILFLSSGCLSPEALEKYAGKQLSAEEIKLVDAHLASCVLCRDAAEGASQIPDFAAHSSLINERLRSRFRYIPGRHRKNPPLSNFLLPAAASVIVLVGIIAWFHYFYPEKQELAIVTDSIPVQLDDVQLQQKAEPVTASSETKEAATIGGVLNRDSDQSMEITPEETVAVPIEGKQKDLPEDIPEKSDLLEETEKESVYAAEVEVTGETETQIAMEEKARAGTKELNTGFAKKSATATRQIESADKGFTAVDQEPEFPGGMDSLLVFLFNKLDYPKEVEQKIDTTVIASFIVSKKGKIKDIEIVRSAGKAFDDEVIRVIKLMPDWIPAKQEGKPIAAKYNLPIRFESD
jgi:protein TonB